MHQARYSKGFLQEYNFTEGSTFQHDEFFLCRSVQAVQVQGSNSPPPLIALAVRTKVAHDFTLLIPSHIDSRRLFRKTRTSHISKYGYIYIVGAYCEPATTSPTLAEQVGTA